MNCEMLQSLTHGAMHVVLWPSARVVERVVAHEAKDPSTKSRFLDLVLVIPAVPYGSTDGAERSGKTASRLNEGQERAYVDLAELMKLRAEEKSFAELPFRASELRRFGIDEPQKETEQLQGLYERSLVTGVRIGDDGRPVVPPHLSASRMYETIAMSSQSLVEALLSTPPQPTFAVELLKAQMTRRNLWREWSELRSALNAGCHGSEQQVDTVPMAMWADIYQKLTTSGSMLSKAAFEPELMEKLLAVQEEQEAAMRKLMEERAQEEVKGLTQLIANLRGGISQPTELAELQERIEKLKGVVETVGLPDKIMQPALQSVAKYMEGSQSETVDLEPLEETMAEKLQDLPLYYDPNIEIKDGDSSVEIIDVDDN